MKRNIRGLAGLAALAGLLLGGSAGRAQDRAGDFDYYVLALSWTPSWCRIEGDSRDAAQCEPGRGNGFLLHGLWPQRVADWPENCRAAVRDPRRSETKKMADLFGSPGYAWHQWKKHGRCSGLESDDYFRLARWAYGEIRRPEILRQVDRPLRVDPDVVEAAFLEANPDLDARGVVVTCRDGLVGEVRICLARDGSPQACTRSVRSTCGSSALLLPMR